VRYSIGMRFLARLATVGAFFLVMITSLVAVRILAQNQGLSWLVVVALAAVQLPHVVTLSAGLAAYWLVDDLWSSGQIDLLMTSGVSPRRVGAAILAPAIALTVVMAVYNTTAARKMVRDLPTLRAQAELRDIEELGGNKSVARVGPVRLGARSATPGELHEAVLSLRSLVIEAPRLQVKGTTVTAGRARVTSLEPRFAGFVETATVTLPSPAPLSWRLHLRDQAASTARSLALALDILALVIAALVCARRGARGRRVRWFALWLAAALAPLLVVQNVITNAVANRPHLGLLGIVAVPLAATILWTVVGARRRSP